jgi:hypothetical protein
MAETFLAIHVAAQTCLRRLGYLSEVFPVGLELAQEKQQWADELLAGSNKALAGLIEDCQFWVALTNADLRPFTVGTATAELCGTEARSNHAAVFLLAGKVVHTVGWATIREQPTQAVDCLLHGSGVPRLAADTIRAANLAKLDKALAFLNCADLRGAGERLAVERDHALQAENERATQTADQPPRLTPEAQAILFVQEAIKRTGKLPAKTAIAKELEVDRRTLNNWRAFRVAYAQLKKNHAPPPGGTKSTDGTLEAWRKSGK